MDSNITVEMGVLIAFAAGIFFGGNLLIVGWISRKEGLSFFRVLWDMLSEYEAYQTSKVRLARITLLLVAMTMLVVAFI